MTSTIGILGAGTVGKTVARFFRVRDTIVGLLHSGRL
jgi:lactate dehydrogenase-like 2-hydroxyacid dehydrogenase